MTDIQQQQQRTDFPQQPQPSPTSTFQCPLQSQSLSLQSTTTTTTMSKPPQTTLSTAISSSTTTNTMVLPQPTMCGHGGYQTPYTSEEEDKPFIDIKPIAIQPTYFNVHSTFCVSTSSTTTSSTSSSSTSSFSAFASPTTTYATLSNVDLLNYQQQQQYNNNNSINNINNLNNNNNLINNNNFNNNNNINNNIYHHHHHHQQHKSAEPLFAPLNSNTTTNYTMPTSSTTSNVATGNSLIGAGFTGIANTTTTTSVAAAPTGLSKFTNRFLCLSSPNNINFSSGLYGSCQQQQQQPTLSMNATNVGVSDVNGINGMGQMNVDGGGGGGYGWATSSQSDIERCAENLIFSGVRQQQQQQQNLMFSGTTVDGNGIFHDSKRSSTTPLFEAKQENVSDDSDIIDDTTPTTVTTTTTTNTRRHHRTHNSTSPNTMKRSLPSERHSTRYTKNGNINNNNNNNSDDDDDDDDGDDDDDYYDSSNEGSDSSDDEDLLTRDRSRSRSPQPRKPYKSANFSLSPSSSSSISSGRQGNALSSGASPTSGNGVRWRDPTDFKFRGRVDSEGNTVLIQAVNSGDFGVISEFLAWKSCSLYVNERNFAGETALFRACKRSSFAMVEMLLTKGGADPNIPDMDRRTPLHVAIATEGQGQEQGSGRIVTALLSCGADTSARDDVGDTPLHWAVREGRDDVMRDLVKVGGANIIGYQNDDGETSIDLAKDVKHMEMYEWLKRTYEEYLEDLNDD